jgi:hypothetical protein
MFVVETSASSLAVQLRMLKQCASLHGYAATDISGLTATYYRFTRSS